MGRFSLLWFSRTTIRSKYIKIFRFGEFGVPSYIQWLKNLDYLKETTIAIDGFTITIEQFNNLEKILTNNICDPLSLTIDELWQSNRPALPNRNVINHDIEYSGLSVSDKIKLVRGKMRSFGGDYYPVTSLDSIAWLLNIRSSDIPNNPVAVSNLLITNDKVIWFINKNRLSQEVKDEIAKHKVELASESNFYEH